MTREDEIKNIALCYAHDDLKDNHGDVEDIVASAFIDGANYADSHPHWISVEDKLPKEGDYVLICNNRGLMTTSLYEGKEWVISETYLAVNVTHWMPLPTPPTCSEFPNKCEKGGNQWNEPQPPTEGIKGNQGKTSPNLSNFSNAGKDLKGGKE